MKNIFSRVSAIILLSSVLFTPQMASAAAFSATDAIGQIRAGNPVFTLNGANNSPNDIGFYNPQGVAVDEGNRRLFVGDTFNGRVLVYELDADGEVTDYSPEYVLGQEDAFTGEDDVVNAASAVPFGLAYDAVNERLFVVDASQNRVTVFDVDPATIENGADATHVLGQVNFTDEASGTALNRMNRPLAVAYDGAHERLFVADANMNRISVFDVDPATIESGADATHRFGEQALVVMPADPTSATTVNEVRSLAYDEQNDRLFAGDESGNRVLVFDVSTISDGMAASHVLGQPDFTSSGFSGPDDASINTASGLAYDPSGERLFVSDDQNRVLVFDVDPATITDGAAAIAVLGQADFDSADAGTSATTLNNPHHMAYDDASGRLFVTDTDNNRVLAYDAAAITDGEAAVQVLGHIIDGTPTFNYQGAHNGPGMTGLNENQQVAVDETNHLFFVADTSNNRVVVFELENDNSFPDYDADYVLGQPDFYTDSPGSTAAKMELPDGVAVDPDNHRLFVADGGDNSRILIFDTAALANGMTPDNVLGQPDLTTIGAPVTVDAKTFDPAGLFYDREEERLFVADWSQSRVLVFDAAPEELEDYMDASYVLGQPDFTTNDGDTTESTLSNPHSIVSDGDRLFVSDESNSRVLVFDLSALANGMDASYVLGQPDFTTRDAGTSSSTMSEPEGLAYSSKHKRLFVADTGNNRVLGFNVKPGTLTNGKPASVVLGQTDFDSADEGVGPTSMWSPTGVAYDLSNNRIYVSDSSNNRVLAYDHIKIRTTTLPAATVGQVYNQEIDTENSQGTVSFALADGELPDGMVLGSVDGTPTEAGTYTFTIQALDTVNNAGNLFDDQEYTLTVNAAAGGGGGGGRRIVASGSAPLQGSGSVSTTPPSSAPAPSPSLSPTPAPGPTPSLPAFQFLNDLEAGMTHGDVRQLQSFLNSHGFKLAVTGPGSPGNETDYFGALTRAAVIAFQEANATEVLAPIGLTRGTGFFGPMSRAAANRLLATAP